MPEHFYYVVFEIGMPGGASTKGGFEVSLSVPITSIEHVSGIAQSIADQTQARDNKGAVMIGGPKPQVLIHNWIHLRSVEGEPATQVPS